jgi:AAA domain (dynein-related subfamily)
LHEVAEHLARLGLHYDRRTLYAFHTALKINDTSQMTVLAGVSGTGKSLLPRRYAEAMGLHFLQIAVEPRWDSPQDLLGFYNYIEKRYRSTELARVLVHMDPFNTSGLSDHLHNDEVMLVLLDEMNLARVEYYFSEFLSRLEVRPRLADAVNAEKRSGACLPIDIPGRTEGPIRLFPSHNVLFAGTMNDDETTQSLSDKVLDRSNVLQFAAPERFSRPVHTTPTAAMARYRSFQAWRRWIRTLDQLPPGDRDKADRVIVSLARIMEDCGRPFGHRLNEAILAYVTNYPRGIGIAVDLPLADQIELRILPKLRGLAIENYQQSFDALAKLIGEELGDRPLAGRLEHLFTEQRQGSGQFNWRGFNRGPG